MMTETVSQRLRQATWALHQQLEQVSVMEQLGHGLDHVATMLECMARAHGAVEQAVLGSDQAASIGFVARTPLIAQGLELLGRKVVPLVAEPLVLGSAAARWGALYVVEGSIMGGQIMLRRLGELYPQLDARVYGFFVPYDDPMSHWQKVRGQLEAQVIGDEAMHQAVAGASATFALFHNVLRG